MTTIVLPLSLSNFTPSEIFNNLTEKITSCQKPNLNVNSKNSVFGKVAEEFTKLNTSTLAERKYVYSIWKSYSDHTSTTPLSSKKKLAKKRRQKAYRDIKDKREDAIIDAVIGIRRDKNKTKYAAKKKEHTDAGNEKPKTQKRPASASKSPRTLVGKFAKTMRGLTQSFKKMGHAIQSESPQDELPSAAPHPSLSRSTSNSSNMAFDATQTEQIANQPSQSSKILPSSARTINDLNDNDSTSQPSLENNLIQTLKLEYENRINVFPTYICPICRRYVYNTRGAKKSIQISKGFIDALRKHEWQDFEEGSRIHVCRRCHTAVQKKKVPAMAFMNNMETGHAPHQLTKLNKIELRMISQVKPFMKIFNLSRGRGQQALKGSVIHFAQNLNEFIKKLPISSANTDLVLVNHTDEHGWCLDDFFVQADFLYEALMWLKTNNPLYYDVVIEMPSEHELQIHEIRSPTYTSRANSDFSCITTHENGFQPMENGHQILRADFHQASDIFPNGGNQCAAMSLSAIAHACLQPCLTWTSTLLNSILIAGDNYYNSIPVHDANGYLSASEVAGEITCFDEIMVKAKIDSRYYHGFLNKVSNGELRLRLQEFIDEQYEYGILTTNVYCIAIIKQASSVFLFDSHARGRKGGLPTGNLNTNSACIIECSLCEAPAYFSRIIHCNLAYKIDKPKNQLTAEERSKLYFTIRPFECSIGQGPSVLNEHNDDMAREDEHQNHPCQNANEQSILHLPNFGIKHTSLDCVITADQPAEPQLEEFLEQMKNQQPRCEIQRPIGCPLYPNREPRLEELSFVKAFPFGRNGYSETRKIPITPLDYFQQRVMGSNTAFHDNEFLFYALSRVEQYTVQQKIGVCGNMRTEEDNDLDSLLKGWDNIHLYMSSIRGSASYWKQYTGDVLAMISQLSTPTFFLTISYDDLNSVDCMTALWKAEHGPDAELPSHPSSMEFDERRNLLNDNPVASARHFSQKLNVIMDILKKHSDSIFGAALENYTYRVEFQGRGSPHVHMLLWLKDVPEWDTEEGVKFIEHNISCSTDVPFKHLIYRYQNHSHTKTCYKTANNICRFGFPRKPSETTKVLNDEEIARNYGRFVELRRTNTEVMINNYHPLLLQLLQCNLDIQVVTGSRAIAFYIGKYIGKSEPTHLRDEIRKSIEKFRSDTTSSYASKALSIANKIISQREVSGPEAAFRLCSLPLRKSSRVTIFVPAYQPQFRVRMVRQDTIGQSKVLQGLNIFDRYVNRPDEYKTWSCIEFAAQFSPVYGEKRNALEEDLEENVEENEQPKPHQIVLKNNKGKMHKRQNPAIIRFPFFNPTEQRDNYLYCLILLYWPFEKEEDILHPINSDGIRASRSIQEAFEVLSPHFRKTSDNPIIRPDLVEQINTVLFLLQEQDTPPHHDDCHFDDLHGVGCFEEMPENLNENEIFVPEPNANIGSPEETIQQQVRNLNVEQRVLFDKVRDKIVNETARPQLLEFCQGSAGTGKSYLIHSLTRLIHTLCPGNERSLIKAAPTGVAGKSIMGSTIHKALSLGIEKSGIAQYYPLGGKRLQERRNMFRQVKYVIIDEISMISYQVLRTIHMRLCEIMPQENPLPFGGLNVIFFGDILQLSPCRGRWIFDCPDYLAYEQNLWKLFSFNELTQTVRQASDDPILPILMRLRIGTLTYSDIEKLKERLIDPSKPTYPEMLAGSTTSLHLYPTVKMVDHYNQTRIETIEKQGIRVYKLKCQDTYAEGTKFGKNVPETAIPKDIRKCGGIAETLSLATDCKVMLKYNADVLGGLCNGSLGVVKGFCWPAFRNTQRYEGHLPASVVVKFEGKIDPKHFSKQPEFSGCVHVPPKSFEFEGNRGTRVCRHQVPLVLCFSCSIHKSQGMTLDSVTVHLGTQLFKPGMSYVACSRVRSWDGLYITEIDPNKLLVNKRGKGPCNEKPLHELYRLKLQKFFENSTDVISDDLIISLLTFILEYVMCQNCKNWLCLCTCT